jgi:DNA-binding transcriptional MerR regulator
VRISELSIASGVPLPTVKYYLREGLLQPGDQVAVNQARYGDAHLRRLRLIRALTEIGGLPLKSVKSLLEAIDDTDLPLHRLLGAAHHALEPVAPPEAAPMADVVDSLLQELGWKVERDAPARRTLGRALETLHDLGRDVPRAVLRRYARAAGSLAGAEVASVPADGSRSEAVETVVVGTVMYEAILNALRRLAQEHYSAERFGDGPPASDASVPRRPRSRARRR